MSKFYKINLVVIISVLCISCFKQPTPVFLNVSNSGMCFNLCSDTSYYFKSIRVFLNNDSIVDYDLGLFRKNSIALENFINKNELNYKKLFIEAHAINSISNNPFRFFEINRVDIKKNKNDTLIIKGSYHW